MKVSVAIKSCHRYAERRKAQLETWLSRLDWDFFFLIGLPEMVIADTLFCNESDAFPDIAPKIKCACQYALSENVDFLFVCDDDTYVHPGRLKASGFQNHDHVGFVRPYGDVTNGFVPYMQGSAYWLSARAMSFIAESHEMKPGIIDDGAVGRALLDRVPFVHDRRYFPGPDCMEQYPNKGNNLITTHKCLPKDMVKINKLCLNS